MSNLGNSEDGRGIREITFCNELGKDLLNGYPFLSLIPVPLLAAPPAFLFSQAWRPASFPPGEAIGTLHRIRQGKNISTTTLDALCEALDCRVEDIIRYEKE